jgi:L-iditol 2-dehydrogenase
MRISQVTGPRRSEVVDEADPVAGPGQVVVEVVASGVCTSDITPWTTGPSNEGPSSGRPIRLGHEVVGRIVGIGERAERWSLGDLVTGLGGNGFATHAVLDAAAILPVPAGLDPALALGEPIAVLEEALGRAGVAEGARVAVVGLGFMGLGLLQLAKTRLPGLVVGVDPSPAARERGLRLGADLVYAPDDLPAELTTSTDPQHESRFDVVLEATGVTPGLTTAGSLVRPFGTLCVVGYHHAGTAKMDMELWYKGVTIVNGFCPERPRTIAAMERALHLLGQKRVSLAPLVTHRFTLDEVDAAFEAMTSRDPGFVKGVVVA